MTSRFSTRLSRIAFALAPLLLTCAGQAHAEGKPAASAASPLGSVNAVSWTGSDEKFDRLVEGWSARSKVPAVADLLAQYPQAAAARPAIGGSGDDDVSAGSTSAIASRLSAAPLRLTQVTSQFGMRVHPLNGTLRMHEGLDLAAPIGTPVYATADGVVEQAQWFGGYGLFVSIDHAGAMETRYGHMSRLTVAAGQRVSRGTIIGYVGSTGRSTGPHLHYEVRLNNRAVNPRLYLPARFGAR